MSQREIGEQPPRNHTVISDRGTSGEKADLEGANLLGGSALSVGREQSEKKEKKHQFVSLAKVEEPVKFNTHTHRMNKTKHLNQTTVLCRCCSSALRRATKFLFVVLEEDCELLQGLVSGPNTPENELRPV